MSKTAIFYIIDFFTKIGGAERNLLDITTRLNPEKFIPAVVCFRAGEAVNSLKDKRVEIIDLDLHKIYSPRALLQAFFLYKLIRKRKVKIVVTYHEGSDFFGSLIARLAGVPVIISSRRDMGYQLKKRHIFSYKFINHFFDRIIAVSDAVKEMIFQKQDAPWHKLITIHNGVASENFSKNMDKPAIKKSLGLDVDAPVVGILAGIRPIKGHKYFLEAAALILKELPNVNFVIVGFYEKEEYLSELNFLAQRLGIEKRVIFTGERIDTAEMLSIMDVSVISSINEGFPNVALESMAAGIPMVATNSGGTPEAVSDGVTGILVMPCDSKALADAIVRLLRDTGLAKRMGTEGRRRVQKLFSIDTMMENTEKLYETLCSEKEGLAQSRSSVNFRMFFTKAIKELIANLLYCSGAFSIIKKKRNGRGIIILAYHRVNEDVFDPWGMNVSISNFEKQMRFISRNYNPVSLEEAIALLSKKKEIPENTIVITFDDGYRDNYTNAFPILKKYNIPATIFLAVGAINDGSLLWFDTIADAFKKTAKQYIDLRTFNLNKYPLLFRRDKFKAINDAVVFGKYLKKSEREEFVKDIREKLNITPENDNNSMPMLKWEDIKIMKDNGISFGSHGMSHTILTKLSEEELEYEIAESKKKIRENIGMEVKLFAYPNGKAGNFSLDNEKLFEKYGYLAACTLLKGRNNGDSNRFFLKRVYMGRNTGLNFLGRYTDIIFDSEISGIFDIMKKWFTNPH